MFPVQCCESIYGPLCQSTSCPDKCFYPLHEQHAVSRLEIALSELVNINNNSSKASNCTDAKDECRRSSHLQPGQSAHPFQWSSYMTALSRVGWTCSCHWRMGGLQKVLHRLDGLWQCPRSSICAFRSPPTCKLVHASSNLRIVCMYNSGIYSALGGCNMPGVC